MGLGQKYKDFVTPNDDLKETIETSVKELLDGKTLADRLIRGNMIFILFITVLGIVYISNGYSTEKLHRKRVELERQVGDLRFESITTAAELMFMSKQSEVLRRVRSEGLVIEESKEPPIKLGR